MPVEVIMPSLSPTMEKGKLVCWCVKEGDVVTIGDVLGEIETDKAVVELEALAGGKIGRLLVEGGTGNEILVKTVIAYILSDDEDISVLDRLPTQYQATVTEVSENESDILPHHVMPAVSVSAEREIPEGVEMVELTVREALREAMVEEMRADADIFILGEEVAEYQGAYKVTQGLLEEFGDKRVIDTPIVEHAFAGLGVGAAFTGLKPIVEFMTFNFAMQAIDQIVNSAAKTHYMSGGMVCCPIVFRGPNGVASRVGAQHSQDYSSWYAHIPGLKVIAPFTAADAKGLLKAAIRDPNPVVVLEHELLYAQKGLVPVLDDFVLPIGRAKIIRHGEDVTLVAHSRALVAVLEAVNALEQEGVQCEVIDLRSLRPLDTTTIINSVRKTNRLVTVEEGWPVAGIGAEISAVVQAESFDDLDAPIIRVTGVDVPLPYASNLEVLALPSKKRIIEAVNHVCYR